jgi:hypothetical protein
MTSQTSQRKEQNLTSCRGSSKNRKKTSLLNPSSGITGTGTFACPKPMASVTASTEQVTPRTKTIVVNTYYGYGNGKNATP